jgi:hypothetical protein
LVLVVPALVKMACRAEICATLDGVGGELLSWAATPSRRFSGRVCRSVRSSESLKIPIATRSAFSDFNR